MADGAQILRPKHDAHDFTMSSKTFYGFSRVDLRIFDMWMIDLWTVDSWIFDPVLQLDLSN